MRIIGPLFLDIGRQPAQTDEERDIAGEVLKHRQRHVQRGEHLSKGGLHRRREIADAPFLDVVEFLSIDLSVVLRIVAEPYQPDRRPDNSDESIDCKRPAPADLDDEP